MMEENIMDVRASLTVLAYGVPALLILIGGAGWILGAMYSNTELLNNCWKFVALGAGLQVLYLLLKHKKI
jgi:hypothetical protein